MVTSVMMQCDACSSPPSTLIRTLAPVENDVCPGMASKLSSKCLLRVFSTIVKPILNKIRGIRCINYLGIALAGPGLQAPMNTHVHAECVADDLFGVLIEEFGVKTCFGQNQLTYAFV